MVCVIRHPAMRGASTEDLLGHMDVFAPKLTRAFVVLKVRLEPSYCYMILKYGIIVQL